LIIRLLNAEKDKIQVRGRGAPKNKLVRELLEEFISTELDRMSFPPPAVPASSTADSKSKIERIQKEIQRMKKEREEWQSIKEKFNAGVICNVETLLSRATPISEILGEREPTPTVQVAGIDFNALSEQLMLNFDQLHTRVKEMKQYHKETEEFYNNVCLTYHINVRQPYDNVDNPAALIHGFTKQ